MTISRVGSQADGGDVDGASTASRAFGSNVTAGNVVWFAAANSDSAHTFVAGDMTKSAGTATLDTIRLVRQRSQAGSGGAYYCNTGLWCAKVTGSGSLTLQVGGGTSGAYWVYGSGEITSTIGFDSNPIETQNDNGTDTDDTSPATTGNGTSAGGAYFVGIAGIGTPNAITITAGGSWSGVFEEEDGVNHFCGSIADRIVTSGTTDQGSWTISGHQEAWSAVLGVIKETSGGGPIELPTLTMPPMRSAGRR